MSISTDTRPFLVACGVEILLLLLGIGLVTVMRVQVRELLDWQYDWVLIGLLGTLPLLVILIWLNKTSWPPMVKIRGFIDEVVKPTLGQLTVLQLLLLAILAGVAEEYFFRGFLQVWLSGMLGPATGLILASLIFGACHLVTPFYGIFAAILGLYLGGLMMFTGNLWPPVIIHALYDFVALVWILKAKPST